MDGNHARASADFLFVRHGDALSSDLIWDRDRDRPLSQFGQQQARDAAAWVAAQQPSALYSSPLIRALQTGTTVSHATGLPCNVEPGLAERSFAALEGADVTELRRRYGRETIRALLTHSERVSIRGCEELSDACARVRRSITTLARRTLDGENEGAPIVLVSHGGPHAWLMAEPLGSTPIDSRWITLGTGRITRFRCDISGRIDQVKLDVGPTSRSGRVRSGTTTVRSGSARAAQCP